VLAQLRERRVGVAKEEMWDPAKGALAKRVLKDLLAVKGRPDAKVEIQVEEFSTTTAGITFQIEEGPRVRVLAVDFEGNKNVSDDELRAAMKNVKEAGLITRLTSRDVYHPGALRDDLERVRFFALGAKGYLEAQIGEPVIKMIERENNFLLFPFRVPLICPPREGLGITVPISEGRRFRFGEIKIEGNTVFSDEQIKRIIGIKSR
jgi:outer membrane protein insertion porin family